jgi:deoxyribodipyrimidine photo-lyase
VWFKRDLRLHDHAPLAAAAGEGPVLAVYLVEPEVWEAADADALHADFVRESLVELAAALRERGIGLVVRRGEAVAVLEELREQTGFRGLWSHEETGNAVTYARDRRVAAWARAQGMPWREFPQAGVVRGLRDRDGWARRWNRALHREEAVLPGGAVGLTVAGEEPGEAFRGIDLRRPAGRQPDLVGGEGEGLRVLDSFAEGRGRGYRRAMSSPVTAYHQCSRLSPYLSWGCLSLRRAVAVVEAARGTSLPKTDASSFLSRCRWHCHFMQKLENEPALEFHCFNRACDDLRPAEPDETRLTAWEEGRTGYPFVDACMRALRARGWINFRMRAMLVSFAAYDLWLDWRHFHPFLARQFIDYEPGIHLSQIQMQSGVTGINTLRIYSPLKQAADHDPDGTFVRTWVPELGKLPEERIQQPWTLTAVEAKDVGFRPGVDYPRPVVDHQEAVRAARARFAALRRTDRYWVEADRVRQQHGSRRSPEDRRRPRRSRREASQLGLALEDGGGAESAPAMPTDAP